MMSGTSYEIEFAKTDIFKSKAHTIVNTINTVGVMGKGLALEFKTKYLEMFKIYKEKCNSGEIQIGQSFLYKDSTPWILNFPTKKHWRGKSKLEYLEQGLEEFKNKYKDWGIKSISFPQLGVRNGGLAWGDVKEVMKEYLSDLDIPVTIHTYSPPRLIEFLYENLTNLNLPDWRLTKNKKSYFYSRGNLKFFWKIGSSTINTKLQTEKNEFESIGSIQIDNSYLDFLSDLFNKLKDYNTKLEEHQLTTLQKDISNYIVTINEFIADTLEKRKADYEFKSNYENKDKTNHLKYENTLSNLQLEFKNKIKNFTNKLDNENFSLITFKIFEESIKQYLELSGEIQLDNVLEFSYIIRSFLKQTLGIYGIQGTLSKPEVISITEMPVSKIEFKTSLNTQNAIIVGIIPDKNKLKTYKEELIGYKTTYKHLLSIMYYIANNRIHCKIF